MPEHERGRSSSSGPGEGGAPRGPGARLQWLVSALGAISPELGPGHTPKGNSELGGRCLGEGSQALLGSHENGNGNARWKKRKEGAPHPPLLLYIRYTTRGVPCKRPNLPRKPRARKRNPNMKSVAVQGAKKKKAALAGISFLKYFKGSSNSRNNIPLFDTS